MQELTRSMQDDGSSAMKSNDFYAGQGTLSWARSEHLYLLTRSRNEDHVAGERIYL